jgi:hypothetical protein
LEDPEEGLGAGPFVAVDGALDEQHSVARSDPGRVEVTAERGLAHHFDFYTAAAVLLNALEPRTELLITGPAAELRIIGRLADTRAWRA